LNAARDFSLGILAGGLGQRWGGRDKGLIAFRGRPLLANACDPRPANAREILICCRDNAHFYSHYADRVLCEITPSRGPCAGISALLSATETESVMILPTDLMNNSQQLIATMTETWTGKDRAVVLTDPHGRHSPCMRLAKETLADCCRFIDKGGRQLSELLAVLGARAVLVDASELRDADSPADFLAHRAD